MPIIHADPARTSTILDYYALLAINPRGPTAARLREKIAGMCLRGRAA